MKIIKIITLLLLLVAVACGGYILGNKQHQIVQPETSLNSVELVCNWYSSRSMESTGPIPMQEYIKVTWGNDGVGTAMVSYNMSITEWDAEVNDLVINLKVKPDSWKMKRIAEDPSTVWAIEYDINRISGFFAAYGNVAPSDDDNWWADSVPVLSSHGDFSTVQNNAYCEKVTVKRF